MTNDTTFVRMCRGDHLGTQKCRKKAPRSVELKFLMNCEKAKKFSQNENRWCVSQSLDLSNFNWIYFDQIYFDCTLRK